MQCYISRTSSQPITKSSFSDSFILKCQKLMTKISSRPFYNFCVSKYIDRLNIYSHRILPRSSLGHRYLPVLSNKKIHKQGQFTFFFHWYFNFQLHFYLASDLCYTKSRLPEDHICSETRKVNYQLSHCKSTLCTHLWKYCWKVLYISGWSLAAWFTRRRRKWRLFEIHLRKN